jgi:hypothetical protein
MDGQIVVLLSSLLARLLDFLVSDCHLVSFVIGPAFR